MGVVAADAVVVEFADVVEFAVVAQGDFAAGVDVVVADTVLGAGFGGCDASGIVSAYGWLIAERRCGSMAL